jgi:hypothetical protein
VTQWLELAKTLSAIGFGTLMVLVLIGSYFGIWVWGKDYRQQVAEAKAREDIANARADKWEAIALRATGVVETFAATTIRRV